VRVRVGIAGGGTDRSPNALKKKIKKARKNNESVGDNQ
jgi:hypothetical protein